MVKLKPLDEQTIVITGASSGIGLATARAAAKAGAKVVMAARDADALDAVAAELREEGCEVEAVPTDVSVEEEVEALADRTIERFGGFDTWVNNAGVGLVGKVLDHSTEDHQKLFQTNYFGVVYGSLAAARHLRDRGSPGAIINLGSVVSDMSIPLSVAYAATKHAIKGFTDGLRVELMREEAPISVTLIKPSGIDTNFFEHAKTTEPGIGKAPGPVYTPDVVAEAILYAAGHQKRDITVGSTATFEGPMARLAPGIVDKVQAGIPYHDLIDDGWRPDGTNLFDVPVEGSERSGHQRARSWSATTLVQTHPKSSATTLVVAAGAAALLSLALARRI